MSRVCCFCLYVVCMQVFSKSRGVDARLCVCAGTSLFFSRVCVSVCALKGGSVISGSVGPLTLTTAKPRLLIRPGRSSAISVKPSESHEQRCRANILLLLWIKIMMLLYHRHSSSLEISRGKRSKL